jgi:hypothetical protein
MPGPGATTGDDTFVGDDLLFGESSQTSTGALFVPGDDTLNDGAGGDPLIGGAATTSSIGARGL